MCDKVYSFQKILCECAPVYGCVNQSYQVTLCVGRLLRCIAMVSFLRKTFESHSLKVP